MDKVLMVQELIHYEGLVLYVYDDANGEPIVSGTTVIGNPTVGIGRLLTKANGVTKNEAVYLCSNDIDREAADLDQMLPWWRTLDEVRQRVLLNMSFNMGIDDLLGFHHMLDAMQGQQWQLAAAYGRASEWYTQVGDKIGERGYNMMQAMETGVMPATGGTP